jgi:hypothetical protein
MMDIPSAAGPDRRRIVYLLAALADVAAGLAIGLAARATPGGSRPTPTSVSEIAASHAVYVF